MLRQNMAVLFSESSRQAYIDEARARGELYAFTDARGREREWLKGQYAYLAPNAASTLLNRLNIKHDVCSETDIAGGALAAYRALWTPNAAALPAETIAAITRWIADPATPDRRLIVTGRTNLPTSLLGLTTYEPMEPAGYTGWRFLPASAFGNTDVWEEFYLTGYQGHAVARATARADMRVLAELWEFRGDVSSAGTATRSRLGDAIVLTDRSLYIANQVLEYMGGAFQAQMNVDDVRGWYYPTHYLDTIGYLLRELLLLLGLNELFATQLRSFGTYEGALVLRHDTDIAPDEPLDLAMLDCEITHQVPATYVVLDPNVSPEHTTPLASKTWVAKASRSNLIEIGLHNDGYAGDPPTYVTGAAMCEHFLNADRALGIKSATAGRHYGFHSHPETLDAMDYLYDHDPDLIGLCTFSVLQVIEYGVRDPAVTWLDRPITYSTRFRAGPWTSGAISGWWFPFHVVIATTDDYRVLRGWDSTKESDCDFDRIDELLAGRNRKDCGMSSRLPNPVFTVQYHPQQAHDPNLNDGQGSLPCVHYLATAAERHRFWLANKRMVYERLNDYQDLLFRVEADGVVVIANPTNRTIAGMMVRAPGPVRSVTGAGSLAYPRIVGETTFTLPPLLGGTLARFWLHKDDQGFPRITQPDTKRLTIVSAAYHTERNQTDVMLRAVAQSNLVVHNLRPGLRYDIVLGGAQEHEWHQEASNDGTMRLVINGPQSTVVPMTLVMRAAS